MEVIPLATPQNPSPKAHPRRGMKALRQELPFATGTRLAELRRYRGLTQRGLSQLLEVDHSLIAKLEDGQQRVDADLIPVFARHLGVTPAEFFSSGPPVLDTVNVKRQLAKTVARGWKYFPRDERQFLEELFRELLREQLFEPDEGPGN